MPELSGRGWRRRMTSFAVETTRPAPGEAGLDLNQVGDYAESHAAGIFIHFAPRLALFTTVSMKAMPSTPSSMVGKS